MEALVVVVIVAALTAVAVPRLQFGAVDQTRAEVVARRITMDLHYARARAILNAGQHTDGCALRMTGTSPYRGYQVIDLADSRALVEFEFPAAVRCTGGARFEFGPLGSLKDGSATQLQIAGTNRTLTVSVTPATGRAKCR